MPSMDPPYGVTATPRHLDLPRGTLLWRVGPDSGPLFRRRPSADVDEDGVPTGGRFDPTPELDFTYLYAGLDDLTAVSEALLRDVGFGAERRVILWRKIRGLTLHMLETTRDLRLASLLDAADLSAVRQDTWLIHAEAHAYPITRRWGHWVRGPVTDPAGPDGLVWPSKRNPTGRAVVFFGDRCKGAVRRCDFGARALDVAPGLTWLNQRLGLLNTRVKVPRP